MLPTACSASGFTLIELSIVLVIIGLIVGGILTGRDLIDTAAQRAQIAQIEKYNTALHTFQGKYGGLPGDIPDPYASNFGFQARGQYPGEGDGNGILQSNCSNNASGVGNHTIGSGELAIFWQDLSTAGLIDTYIGIGAGYPNESTSSTTTLTSTPKISGWLPTAKIGTNNFVYVISIGNGTNYYTVSSVTQIICSIYSTSNPGLTVQQAYNIDSKIDDGLPQSGNVIACYQNFDVGNSSNYIGPAGGLTQGAGGSDYCASSTAATPYANTTCYDNSYAGGSAAVQKYQLQNAPIQNCALSFRFQ